MITHVQDYNKLKQMFGYFITRYLFEFQTKCLKPFEM